MTAPIPTRAALRALARLCHPEGFATRSFTCRRFTHRHEANSPLTNGGHGMVTVASFGQVRHRTTLAEAPEPQTFANDPSRYDPQHRTGPEPRAQGTSDPMSESSGPVLPDVSNYYTLFPKTIPNGPPRAAPRVPDSSSLIDREPSKAFFYINPRDLRKEFLQLQSRHHPDKFPAGSVAHQKAYALSTLLNNAYKTLSDPLLRAQYLLQMLYDIDVTSEDNSAHPADPSILMEVMEAQEELENATDGDSRQIVESLKEQNKSRIRETEKLVGAAFEAGDSEAARTESVKLKYWRSLESGLQEWEPGKEVRLTH